MNQRTPTLRRIVGVDVGGTKVRALAADAQGEIIDDTREHTDRHVVAQIARIARELGGDQLSAVAVGVPGAVHPTSGLVSMIPNVPALEGVRLGEVLTDILGVTVSVENDLAMAALAESGANPDAELLAVVAAGTGIGLGIVHRGVLVRGAGGAAGEIAGIALDAGRILEDVVSVSGILTAYAAHSGGRGAELGRVLELATAHDPAASAAVGEYAEGLAHAVRIVLAVLDPDRLVLTGGLASAAVVRAALHTALGPDRDRVALSRFGADSPAHGALRHAREGAASA